MEKRREPHEGCDCTDSFKGSLTALQVGITVKKAFLSEIKDAEIEVVPMADGGEGTFDALVHATNGKVVEVEATGPLRERTYAAFGVLGDKQTVVVEMAGVAGLPMVPEEMRNPLHTTTYGVGELIRYALDQGYRKFIIGIGGSATNDGGMGMLQALGVTFSDEHAHGIEPTGAGLAKIKTVNFDTLDPRIGECEMQVACDVKNPLCGPTGASYVFGPQKGADPEQVKALDQGLAHYAALVESALGSSYRDAAGAGAAGGIGFAFLAIGAELISGSQIVADATGLEEKIKTADWVITGEGQSDFQTLYGKVPSYVAKLAQRYGVKSVLLSGGLGKGFDQLYDYFVSCHSITRGPASLETCIRKCGAISIRKRTEYCAADTGRLSLTAVFNS